MESDIRLDDKGNVLPPGMLLRGGVYYVRKEQGGIERKLSTGKRDFKSALRRYHEMMQELNNHGSGWTKPAIAVSAAEYWKQTYRPTYTVLKTPLPNSDPKDPKFRDDQLIVSFLATTDAKRPIDQYTKSMAQKWVNSRRRDTYVKSEGGEVHTIAEGTVTREISFLQAMFQQALEDGLIEKNPWKRIERENYVTKERVLTESEQEKLLSVLSPRYQRWVLFMVGTGLRLEEGRQMNPATDLSFDAFPRRWAQVTRKTRGRKKKVQKVPLIDPYILDVLQEQLTEDGDLWHQNQQRFREVLAQACERAGVEHISPHTLRHTFATRYLQSGGDIYVLSKILGHASVAITEKVYAHLLTEDLLLRSQNVRLGLAPVKPAKVLAFKEREA
jgi:integrase